MAAAAVRRGWLAAVCAAAWAVGCGGGGGGGDVVLPALPPTLVRVSAATPVVASCPGDAGAGSLYVDAEVEPFVAGNRANPAHLVGTWQQDRWSNGAARAVVTAVSFDGGRSWAGQLQPFSRCGGAAAGSAGDFERVSDPWVDIGPDGSVHAMALALNVGAFLSGSASAMLAARSTDGGRTWSAPSVLVLDGPEAFNDKNALTADPTDARYVYAVWDRLDPDGRGPTWLARSVDGGASWERAREIYVPASTGISQTLGNRIVVRPDGGLVNLFTQIDTVSGTSQAWLGVLRSADKGATWSGPVRLAELQSVGARDPQTGKAIRDGSSLGTIAAAPDGTLWVAWQDARFSGGQRDAIAVSRSTDGGTSWSAPGAINVRADVAAFTPAIAVRADGTVGVLHYDLRDDTADAGTLLASAWLLQSRDGQHWSETRVGSAFDMAQAPDAGGLFLGDYQGLAAAGAGFVPFLALATGSTTNRTDVFADRTPAAAAATATGRARALDAARAAADAGTFAQARHAAIVRSMQARVPDWAARTGARTAADGPSPR